MQTASSARLGVGPLIQRARRRRGYSQRQLSARAGRAPAYVQKVENGSIIPNLRCFASLVVALDMNVQEVWLVVCAEARNDAAAREAVTPAAYAVHSHNGREGR